MREFCGMKLIKLTDVTRTRTHFVGTLDMEEALNAKVKKTCRRMPRSGDSIIFNRPDGEIVRYVYTNDQVRWVAFSVCCEED